MRFSKKLSLFFLLFIVISPACKKKKKESTLEGEIPINIESITFVRSANKASGTLSFTSIPLINCDLEYWNDLTKTAPAAMDCNEKNANEFSFVISPIEPELAYTIKVSFWEGETRENVKYFTVREKSSDSEAEIDSLVIARMLVPQYATEIYRHKLDGKKSVTDLRVLLSPQVGCKETKNELTNMFNSVHSPLLLESVSTSGFAEGAVLKDPFDPERLALTYEFLQTNLNWSWAFVYEQENYNFTSRPPAYLTFFSINNEKRLGSEARDLLAEVSSFTLKEGNLNLTWKARNLTAVSYLSVEIKSLDESVARHCIFKSRDGSGVISSEMLDNLPTGDYHFTAVLESNQIHHREASKFPTWLISSQDFRYAKLTKL